jgi:sugar fermentation stimulation protein A
MPDYHTDFAFSRTFLSVRNAVKIIPAAVCWDDRLSLADEVRELNIPWEYLHEEVKDRGCYLLLMKMNRDKMLEIGKLGRREFKKGYYIYVGSAMKNLSARIARHRRKRKVRHWHIDYLRNEVSSLIPVPIRSSQRLECELAGAISSIMAPGPEGFGSSDCNCGTHLFWSHDNPLNTEIFHTLLAQFRMRPPG